MQPCSTVTGVLGIARTMYLPRRARVSGAVAERLRGLMEARESFYLGGSAGVGKSLLVDHVIRPYDEANTLVLGSTHRAYLQIGGEDTLDAVMEKVKRRKLSLTNMRVLVDEVSMCYPRHMMWLQRQKVYCTASSSSSSATSISAASTRS